jgi:hypothetical protein
MGRSSAARSAVVAAFVVVSALSGQAALGAADPPRPALAADATPSPSPNPSPSADPSPTPSPAPSPSPSAGGSPSPSPNPSSSPGASPTPSPSGSPAPSPTPSPSAPTRQALPPPGASIAVLGSDTLQISGLRSIAVTTVDTSSGPVKVIRLVADASTITGLNLLGPCTSRTRVNDVADEERATGGVTLDATALQATILGVSIIIAAEDLPQGQLTLPGVTLPPLPTDLAILSVRLFVLQINSGGMGFSGLRSTTAAC